VLLPVEQAWLLRLLVRALLEALGPVAALLRFLFPSSSRLPVVRAWVHAQPQLWHLVLAVEAAGVEEEAEPRASGI
jgi:hypothetical protein